MKKIIVLFISLFIGFILTSCGEVEKPKEPVELPLTSSYGIGDQSKLFGMCYLLEQRDYWGSNFDINDVKVEVELMKNLGVKTVRHWMHCTRLMVDKDTLNETQCELMHETLKQCSDAGIMNIVMNIYLHISMLNRSIYERY